MATRIQVQTRLDSYRRSTGASAREFARTLGIGEAALRRISKYGDTPNLRTAAKIVRGTERAITFDDLLPDALRSDREQHAP